MGDNDDDVLSGVGVRRGEDLLTRSIIELEELFGVEEEDDELLPSSNKKRRVRFASDSLEDVDKIAHEGQTIVNQESTIAYFLLFRRTLRRNNRVVTYSFLKRTYCCVTCNT